MHGWDAQEEGHGTLHEEPVKGHHSPLRDEVLGAGGEVRGGGLNIERYDRVKDFTKDIALVPISAREGEGIRDLLAVVIGLAERYLAEQLTDVEDLERGRFSR